MFDIEIHVYLLYLYKLFIIGTYNKYNVRIINFIFVQISDKNISISIQKGQIIVENLDPMIENQNTI